MKPAKSARMLRYIALVVMSLVLLQGQVQPAQAAVSKRACIIIVYDPWGSLYRTARNEGVTCHAEITLELWQVVNATSAQWDHIGSQYVVKADRNDGRARCVITRKGQVYAGQEQINYGSTSASGGATCSINSGHAPYVLNYQDIPFFFYTVISRVDRIAG